MATIQLNPISGNGQFVYKIPWVKRQHCVNSVKICPSTFRWILFLVGMKGTSAIVFQIQMADFKARMNHEEAAHALGMSPDE